MRERKIQNTNETYVPNRLNILKLLNARAYFRLYLINGELCIRIYICILRILYIGTALSLIFGYAAFLRRVGNLTYRPETTK